MPDETREEIPVPRDFLLHTQGDVGSDSEMVVAVGEDEDMHGPETIFASEDSQDSVATVRHGLGGRGGVEQGAGGGGGGGGGGGLLVHSSITPPDALPRVRIIP